MNDPKTFWLTVMNIVLGLAVVLMILGVCCGVICEFVAKLKRRRTLSEELDRDMEHLFHTTGRPGRPSH
jgi:cytochrome c oxidase assembly factor CtaG